MKSWLENKSPYIIEVENIEPQLIGPKWTYWLAGLATYAVDFLVLILFIPLLVQLLIYKLLLVALVASGYGETKTVELIKLGLLALFVSLPSAQPTVMLKLVPWIVLVSRLDG